MMTRSEVDLMIRETEEELDRLSKLDYESEHIRALTLKPYRDFLNAVDAAKEEGIEIGSKMVATNMLKENVDVELIAETTGLSIQIIEDLK